MFISTGVSLLGAQGNSLPNVVTTGLKLWWDAGIAASYPGTGTTITDLSGNGNDGTLQNNIVYTSSFGGGLYMASGEDENAEEVETSNAVFEFEPDKNELLEYLLPRNFLTQIYRSILESSASEHAARMTSMDNATRNAGDMIDRLTLTYNRTRQAFITKELIEIISGAEAV